MNGRRTAWLGRGRVSLPVTLVVMLMAAVMPAAPAQAAMSWTLKDPRYDSRFGIDIKSTTLSAQPRSYRVAVRGYNFTRRRLNVVALTLDSDRVNVGPEYGFAWWLPGDGDGVEGSRAFRLENWAGKPATRFDCLGLDFGVNFDTDLVIIRVPRRCVAWPSQVRWNVKTWHVTEYQDPGWEGHFDAVPALNRFGPWVA